MTAWNVLEGFVRDVAIAARSLRRQPTYVLVVVASLALAVGSTTALFSVVNAVVLRPLPFRHADRLVRIWQTDKSTGSPMVHMPTSVPTLEQWRAESRTLPELAGMQRRLLMLGRAGRKDPVSVGVVSSMLFPMLGIQPSIGRTFEPREDRPGVGAVALVSERALRTYFAGERSIVGQDIQVDDSLCTVVGVVPDVEVPELGQPDIWLPLSVGLVSHSHAGHTAAAPPSAHAGHANHRVDPVFSDPKQRVLTIVGQLAADATPDQARQELMAISARNDGGADPTVEHGLVIYPVQRLLQARVQRPLTALIVAAVLIFVIACTNVTHIVMTRLTDRVQELGVRVALGSSQARLTWTVLAENVILTAASLALGCLLASWLLAVLVQVGPVPLPRRSEVAIDRQALAFAAGVSLVAAALFGFLPLSGARRRAPQAWLARQSRSVLTGERRERRLRQALLATEIALSVALLIGVGLAVRSFWKLKTVDLGFVSGGVVVGRVDPPAGMDPPRLRAFYDDIVGRLTRLPGVQAAGATGDFPLHSSWWTTAFTINGQPWPENQLVTSNYARVAGDYFGAMRIALRQGRLFDGRDGPEAHHVAVVNDAFVKRFLPKGRAIGSQIQLDDSDSYEVVGIVADTVQRRLNIAAQPHFYLPYAQNARGSLTFAVRSAVSPGAMAGSMTREVAAVSKEARVSQVGAFDALIADAMAPERYVALLLGVVGLMATILVSVGVYGLTAHGVARRTPEIGVRLTLGATPAAAQRLVLGQSLSVAAAGVVLGTVLAVWLSTTMRGLIFGITVTDPVTFTAVPSLILVITALAAYLPARRASRIDPVIALRYE